ncbi:LCP family protein [Geodermatophilus poikilotrophus]|uniref:Cell envelope-related function transcriptional attenuator common domain-containing protein n=1 Tax=Geodermatophilus poikilotrophus TaxID=1333667 RepID=A0A1I0H1T7_9ACTN|nr:LCP family protein [Geodermatophilus poikilotrophus]SET77667.1 cell envelope-related function transcriptional attenuator common domain-containing protein [Geodermatophilus poikilotrophus]
MSPKNPGPPAAGGDRQLPARLDPRAGRSASGRARSRHQVGDGSEPDGPEPRRRTGRAATAARVVAGVLSVVLLAGSGWGWYLGQVAEATVNRTDAIPDSGNDGGGAAAVNLLLVGNDSRADLTEEQLAELNAGADSGVNTDTMILVHVPADGSRASFVSFPRDSYVQIPGYGWDKLNAAYAYGYADGPTSSSPEERQASGARLLVQTVSGLTGLRIDHYAEVDLLGFFNLSSVVGGVEINLCEAVDDSRWSGAVFPAGKQTISGGDALKFVRQRHGLPRSDFDRIVRQQVFIAGVLRKMLSDDVLLDLGKQRELVEAASQSLTIDQSLDLFQLAEQMQSVTAGSIEFQTVPFVGDDEDEEGRYILRLEDEDALHDWFAELSAEPETPAAATPAAPATVAPLVVTVDVYNGSGTPGLAAEAAGALRTAGFAVGSTGNADSTDYTRTVVRHAAGDEALAATLAATLPGAVVEAGEDATSGTVELVLGSDFNGVGQAVTPPAPSEPVQAEDARTAADTTCIY